MKRTAIILGFLAAMAILAIGQDKKQEGRPWDWSPDKIRASVAHVRAGRDLTPGGWPGGARVAVALSFDFDAETTALRNGNLSPGALSQGEYAARTSLPRILALLDKYRIPATFFIPAVTAHLHPEEIKAILSNKRHEIGMHGWIHERNAELSGARERELMMKSFEFLRGATGKSPAGIRTPSWDFGPATLAHIRELGLVYDSSLMADDRPYELLENGVATGVIELPVEWILDDYFYFGFGPSSGVHPPVPPMDVFSIWAAEFDKAYEEKTLFLLTLHPEIIGHRSRILMLEKLIQHILERKDVWFATHLEIAKYVKNPAPRKTAKS